MHDPATLAHVRYIFSSLNVGVENEDLAGKIQNMTECMRESESLACTRQMEKLYVLWKWPVEIPEGPPVSL